MEHSWWASMTRIEHFYWILAVAASTLLLIQLVMAFISGADLHLGHDIDAGHGSDFDSPHFQLISIRSIVAFFAVFGWTGLAFYHNHLSIDIVIIFSFLCGLAMMALTAFMFYGLSKMQSSGTLDLKAAIGLTASVYLKIPAAGKGSGQITVVLQGKKMELEAETVETNEIPTGASVTIKALTNSKATVERIQA